MQILNKKTLEIVDKISLILSNYIDIISLLFIILCIFFEQYKLIISLIFFRIFHFLKNTKYGKAKISIFKNDREIIDNHWSNDRDLIYLTYFCRGLYLLGVLNVGYSIISISRIDIYSSLNSVSENAAFFLFFGYFLISTGILLTGLAEFHIIFFRNTPVKEQIIQGCFNCLKISVAIGGFAAPILEVASNTPAIRPNSVTNAYQNIVPWGRHYSYETGFQMVQHDALKGFSGYDKTKLIDSNTNYYSSSMERVFIEQNKEAIRKELPAAQCNILGLKKGRLY